MARVSKELYSRKLQLLQKDTTGGPESKKLLQRLNAQYALAHTLSQHEDRRATLSRVLEVIGETLAWEVGSLWVIDETKEKLKCEQIWEAKPGKNNAFIAATKKVTFELGEGLPGRTWETKHPQWVEDVTKVSFFLRAKAAVKDGLHGAFAFPVLLGGKVLGVIDFESHGVRPPDEDLLKMVGAMGQQIGQYLAHMQAIEEQQSLLEQLRKATQKAEQAAIEAEERASEMDAIFNSLGDALFIYKTGGKVVSVNPAAVKLFGFNPVGMQRHSLIGKSLLRHRHGDEVTPNEWPSTLALAGKTVISKYLMVRNPAGKDLMVTCSATPIKRQGSVTGAVMLLHDVSQSWQVEKQKDDFVAMASHELRTPVATIKAFAQILQRHLEKSTDEEVKKYVSKMNIQLKRLNNLVDELLDATRIGAGLLDLHKEKFDLEKLVRDLAEDFRNISDKHAIIVRGGLRKKVPADRDRIGQVLLNFLSNAVKYSPKSKKIIVTIKESDGNALVSVRDYGIGIRPEDQEKVFDRFFRVNNKRGERFPGLGLGLNISAEIIKRHEGKIGVKSASGKGSVFFFSLPLKKSL